MSAPRRVVITGMGVISCLGRGRDATTRAAKQGELGIREITSIDTTNLMCRIGGEISANDLGDDFRDQERFVRLALIASDEAVTQANLSDPSIDRSRIATLIGTGLGGTEMLDSTYQRLYGDGLTRMPPLTIPRIMYNAATSAVSARHKALGPAYSIVSACASATHSIGQAFHWVRNGLADMALAGGSDAPFTIGSIRAWESLRVLASANGDARTACRPFSADRRGLVLAEGAGVVVLESLESARHRNQPILGEVIGFGLSSDAGHITDPSAAGASRAIQSALDDAGISPSEVEYINAHGTATRANDPTETAAIRRVFGAHADRVPVSSTKSAHGHAMGASGAIELVLSLLALNKGVIPATMNYNVPDPACDLDYVPNQPRSAQVRTFLSNSFGFGGVNGVLAVQTIHGTP
jgi:nodulation protein E